MSFAARVSDATNHPGTITGPGVVTVLIKGLPAAVVGDTHACSMPPPTAHPPNPVIKGSASVLIGGRPAVRVGDTTACGAQIITGEPSVLIGG